MNHKGDATASEDTDVTVWYDKRALHVKARCHTAAMDRIRTLAARKTPYARDAWGDDALEVSIDPRQTRLKHKHFIMPPNGLAITFIGSNNRQEQGWNPPFNYRVSLEDKAWVIEAEFPFAMLGRTPKKGETWGFNVLRVNRSEPTGYVQWAPTFGDALRTELLGEIQFSGTPGNRTDEIATYMRRASERKAFFLSTINGIREEDALHALGMKDWASWGKYLAGRKSPTPLRWEDSIPGAEGVPDYDRAMLMEMADTLVEQIAQWSIEPPDPRSFGIEPLEALGDAYLLTRNRKYVDAFEHALKIHARRMRQVQDTVTAPDQLHYATNPYHDAQIIRTEMMSYVYLSMRKEPLAPETHAIMMLTVMRGCRFATFNISSEYTYGNHQVYESGGLASVAALFPEFPESNRWANAAARSIRLHFEREVYPDGGYAERCGYHTVAMGYVMHAVATIRINKLEKRFPDLMNRRMQGTIERMHDWLLMMVAPDGTFPAFGDCGASTMLRFLLRGAIVFKRPDLAWPLAQTVPAMVPKGMKPRKPSRLSAALASHFTIMRDGWTKDSMFMVVDSGPLGGQHSHLDTLGFVAYANGMPVAMDSGISTSYDDPRYVTVFRSLRAHNVVVIDDIETEKVAERVSWKPGKRVDKVVVRSHAYEHALGVMHDRTILFVKGTGWVIRDRLVGPKSFDFARHRVDWMLHTPYALKPEMPGVLHAATAAGGLVVLAGRQGQLNAPMLEQQPASMPPQETLHMRLWDAGRRLGKHFTPNVTCLALRKKPVHGNTCEFVTALLPYRGNRPDAQLVESGKSWTLRLGKRAETLPL